MNYVPYINLLYKFCKRYVDFYRGENNSDILTNGEYHLLKKILLSCNTVFDVGAFTGNWSSLALGENPNLQIHCFEPSEHACQTLETLKLKGDVTINNMAMGAEPGQMSLHFFEESRGMNSFYNRTEIDITSSGSVKVKVDTIDNYCSQRNIQIIDFLKVDVEGHELEVLKGAVNMLSEGKIKRIQFEYGGTFIDSRTFLKDIFNFLLNYDFKMHKIYPDQIKYYDRYLQTMENFQYQNWIALKDLDF